MAAKLLKKIMIIVFIAILCTFGIVTYKQILKIEVLGKGKSELEETFNGLKDEEQRLRQEIELLQHEEYIADLARAKYQLTKENEKVFIVK